MTYCDLLTSGRHSAKLSHDCECLFNKDLYSIRNIVSSFYIVFNTNFDFEKIFQKFLALSFLNLTQYIKYFTYI